MQKMETHMNNRETEKTELEKEVTGLRRAVENGGTMENHNPEHQEKLQKQQEELEQQKQIEQNREEEEHQRQLVAHWKMF